MEGNIEVFFLKCQSFLNYNIFQMCLENTYGPLILMKQPEQFEMTVVFGNMEPGSTKKCPDQSKLKITGSFNVSLYIFIHIPVVILKGTIFYP